MKRTVGATIAALGLAAFHTPAQIPAGLDISMCTRLSITGSVGTVYAIQYVTDLTQTNDPGAWRCLEFLQLPASPYVWADKATPASGRRFYRGWYFLRPRTWFSFRRECSAWAARATKWGVWRRSGRRPR